MLFVREAQEQFFPPVAAAVSRTAPDASRMASTFYTPDKGWSEQDAKNPPLLGIDGRAILAQEGLFQLFY
jgi:hypothetical protein